MTTVPKTNIYYTIQPVQNLKADYLENDTIRLVFRSQENSMVNLRESTINFQLNMPALDGANALNAPIYYDTVANLFQVQSVSVAGQKVDFVQSDYKDVLIRHIRAKCTNKGQGQYMSGYDYRDSYVDPYTADLGTAATNFGLVQPELQYEADINLYNARVHNNRNIKKINRHYELTPGTGVFTKIAAESCLQQYSVKLSELVPEFMDISVSQSQMLLKLGLEVQLRLLPFSKVMSWLWITETKTTNPTRYDVPGAAFTKYSISDLFVGMVMALNPNPMQDQMISKDWAFQTHHCITQSIGTSSFTANWSLPSSCFVNCVVLAFNTPNPFTNASAVKMPVRGEDIAGSSLAIQPPVLTCGQGNLFYALGVQETQLQLNGTNFPLSLPPFKRQNQKMVTAAAFSQMAMGSAYESCLTDFLSYEYQMVEASSLFQLYQVYTAISEAQKAALQVNILTICERVMSVEGDNLVVLR